MRVLVCGSRQWTDRERLYAVLDAFHANTDPIEVVIGNDDLDNRAAARGLRQRR